MSTLLRFVRVASLLALGFSERVDGEEVSFAREVLPLLSDRCFKCHGPDEQARKANLRLDVSSVVEGGSKDGGIVVPGNLERSELYRRITTADVEDRMPPVDSGMRLTEKEIDLLRQWITEGASWEEHWAFRQVQRPAVPQPTQSGWSRNPIDEFILSALEGQGLGPSAEVDSSRALRRVHFSLTGLPPDGIKESERYETVVDRLLASPAYGERVAQLWLDLARYADTSGYQNDGPRVMWRWRDWVIDALNSNMSFAQFTREQLAGDLLPAPTLEQRIATGFNRNHRGNAEGGIVPEEYAVEYVVDRVETMGTVWLGLTIGCARCHDHKYDPISQQEFYQLYAFFNNIPEHGRAIKEGNSPPFIKAPTESQATRLRELDAARARAEAALERLEPELAAAQRAWEKLGQFAEDRSLPHLTGLQASLQFDQTDLFEAASDSDWRVRVVSESEESGEPTDLPESDREQPVYESETAGNFGYFDRFSISLWIQPMTETGTIWSRMLPTARSSGYSLDLVDGRLHVNQIRRWLDDAIRVRSSSAIELGEWHHVAVVYDGTRVASGIRLYLNGAPVALEVDLDGLNQSFAVEAPFVVGAGNEDFLGRTQDLRIYNRDLMPAEIAMLAVNQSTRDLVALATSDRTTAQSDRIRNHFLSAGAKPERVAVVDYARKTRAAYRAAYDAIPTVMVMQERSKVRPAFVLNRGRYDQPKESVSRGVPKQFPPLSSGDPLDRRGLAEWLTQPTHPLTARVLANRIWQMHFGVGLVRTPENFGIQGEPPTHPELLDWLAMELIESGWDMKHLHRLIVTSATYRQRSEWTPTLIERDPENRWYARGPRYRLPGEWVRDRALKTSGLLTRRIGGPSVKPYQPEGLWKEIASDTVYELAKGSDLYRRSLYTYWKRTVSPPLLAAFDAPSREACVVQRSRTNTPLQALGLLNETGFLEAAKALANRVVEEAPGGPDRWVRRALERALSRAATEGEVERLFASFEQYASEFKTSPAAAEAILSVGSTQFNSAVPDSEMAALTMVCSTIMNLDEFVTLD